MASRTRGADSARTSLQTRGFSASRVSGGVPGIHREITGVWVPVGYPAAVTLVAPGLLGGDVPIWPGPGADSFVQRVEVLERMRGPVFDLARTAEGFAAQLALA
jgi:hypothetical protein